MAPPDLLPVNDLRRSWLATSAEVREAVRSVIESGWYVQGPHHDAFELEFATFLGARHAVGVASGTDALLLALLSVGCGPGSEVVTVANAGGYASIAAAQVGCDVVYADVDATSLLMQPQSVERAIGDRTRAVVVTHLFGNVADVEAITEVCRPLGIAVIEDCAQAIGAARDGRRVGTIGTIGAFSFYPTKNLGALGDAGALVTDDDELADHARKLRQYGWSQKYRVTLGRGRNSRLDEVQAAVLRLGLPKVGQMNARRQAIVRDYTRAADRSGIRIVTGNGCPTVAHLAVIRVADRDRLRDQLLAARIASDVHYPVPDHRQPGLPPPARLTSLAETERAANEIVTVPCFPQMTDDEVRRISEFLSEAGGA